MTNQAPPRLRSIDVLRGIACVLMAIDHVRVYSGLPAGGPTQGIFFTRWITYFVAPAFCFLAGPSPGDWPILLRVLGQQKYPATQLFLLMTLGPIIALIPVAERAHGWVSAIFATFGRVPMFFYLLHIPVIHASAVVVSLLREGKIDPWLFGNHPVMPPPQPPGYMWSLGLLYLVYFLVLPILYVVCRWYARIRREHPRSVLKYI